MQAFYFYPLLLLAYLLGSINAAIIVCKLLKLPSPRSIGSGNPGATNVLRLGGKKAALITALIDVIKGVIPVLIGRALHGDDAQLALLAFFAVLGHLFPIFFAFKGGKGVATLFGTLLALHVLLGLLLLLIWILVAALFRYASLASIVSTLLMPVLGFFMLQQGALLPLMLMALFVLWRHKGNFERLLQGRESKLY